MERLGAASAKASSWGVVRPGEAGVTGLRLFDLLAVAVGLWAACRVHETAWQDQYTVAAGAAGALFLVLAERNGLYRSWRMGGLRQEVAQTLVAWAAMVLGLVLLGYLSGTSSNFPRPIFLTWSATSAPVLVASRLLGRKLLRAVRARGGNGRTVAIAGAGDLGLRVAEAIRSAPWMGYESVGFFDDRRRVASQARGKGPVDIRGSLDDMVEMARRGEVDVVFLALPMRAEKRMKSLVRALAATSAAAYFVPDLVAFALLRSRWLTCGVVPTVSLFDAPLSRFEFVLKRLGDLLMATLFLAIAAIPMLLIAAGIKATSPGPVIFKQRRNGRIGHEIIVWKFRTMTVCESGPVFQQALRDDPRVTRFGAFLRATSCDELPQLINVLQGRMSLVGPRPHPIPLTEQHREVVDWYMLRHRVKPGLTGWAQVNGFRGETDTPEKMQGRIECDLEYIHNWSVWLDLKIIVLTVFRGFTGKNAY